MYVLVPQMQTHRPKYTVLMVQNLVCCKLAQFVICQVDMYEIS